MWFARWRLTKITNFLIWEKERIALTWKTASMTVLGCERGLKVCPRQANEPSSQGLKIRGWSCFLQLSSVWMLARDEHRKQSYILEKNKQTKHKISVYRIMLELWGNKCVSYLGTYSASTFHVLVFKVPVFLWTILSNSLVI